MRDRGTRAWARVLGGVGYGIVATGLLLAGLAFVSPASWWGGFSATGPSVADRLILFLGSVVLAVGVGAPLVLAGSLAQVFLDQRRLLARQWMILRKVHERLDLWEDVRTGRDERRVMDRLLSRRTGTGPRDSR